MKIERKAPVIGGWHSVIEKMDSERKSKEILKKPTYYDQKAIATPPWADKKKIEDIYKSVKRLNKTKFSYKDNKGNRIKKYSVDHIIPLRGELVCGLHVHWNLQIITIIQNATKGNRIDTILCEPMIQKASKDTDMKKGARE